MLPTVGLFSASGYFESTTNRQFFSRTPSHSCRVMEGLPLGGAAVHQRNQSVSRDRQCTIGNAQSVANSGNSLPRTVDVYVDPADGNAVGGNAAFELGCSIHGKSERGGTRCTGILKIF